MTFPFRNKKRDRYYYKAIAQKSKTTALTPIYMKSITCLLIACSLSPNVAIAAVSQPPAPIPSEPCVTVTIPSGGTMCAPTLAVAPVKLGEIIYTKYDFAARHECHRRGGNLVMKHPTIRDAYECFIRSKSV